MQKRTIIIVAVVVLAVLAGWFGYNRFVAAPAREAAATPEVAQAAESQNVIWASGKLVPEQWAGLSPATAGVIRAFHVREGDRVEAGAVLAELDNAVLRAQIETAKAAVAEAEAAEARLLAGATPAELDAAHAEVAAANAAVALAEAGALQAKEAIAAAQAQVAIAQAQYNDLASRPTPAERLQAQLQVDLAAAALQQAQRAYDQVAGDPAIGRRPEALALDQATLNHNAAQAAYNVAVQGATPQQLAAARAQIEAARRQVAGAQLRIPEAVAGVDGAKAQLARAQAGSRALTDGPTAADKAMATARVQQARAALATAEAQLRQAQIMAPFAGQVGEVLTRVGEQAAPGVPALMLGDTSRLLVETTDLRETDVAKVEEGMTVEVTFDALPGRSFQGVITHIATMSTVEKGSTNYTIKVDVTDLDPNLRWGMTAFVNIQPNR